jgi:hypothetical protein
MKNILKTVGNGVTLTAALAAVLLASSCKKESQIAPLGSANAAGANKSIAVAKSNYKVSQPITLNGVHDITISGDSISGGANSCISLVNCYNIHITNCKLVNSSAMGVNLSACSNIIVDDCVVANVATGVYSYNGKNISVMNNKMKNLSDPQAGGTMVAFESLGEDAKDAASNSAMNNELAR